MPASLVDKKDEKPEEKKDNKLADLVKMAVSH